MVSLTEFGHIIFSQALVSIVIQIALLFVLVINNISVNYFKGFLSLFEPRSGVGGQKKWRETERGSNTLCLVILGSYFPLTFAPIRHTPYR